MKSMHKTLSVFAALILVVDSTASAAGDANSPVPLFIRASSAMMVKAKAQAAWDAPDLRRRLKNAQDLFAALQKKAEMEHRDQKAQVAEEYKKWDAWLASKGAALNEIKPLHKDYVDPVLEDLKAHPEHFTAISKWKRASGKLAGMTDQDVMNALVLTSWLAFSDGKASFQGGSTIQNGWPFFLFFK